MVAHEVFDSESLNLMQAAVEQAWIALPPDRRTPETRVRIAQAVFGLATLWDSDDAEQMGSKSLAEHTRRVLGVELWNAGNDAC